MTAKADFDSFHACLLTAKIKKTDLTRHYQPKFAAGVNEVGF
jgi:hypothetical protein